MGARDVKPGGFYRFRRSGSVLHGQAGVTPPPALRLSSYMDKRAATRQTTSAKGRCPRAGQGHAPPVSAPPPPRGGPPEKLRSQTFDLCYPRSRRWAELHEQPRSHEETRR